MWFHLQPKSFLPIDPGITYLLHYTHKNQSDAHFLLKIILLFEVLIKPTQGPITIELSEKNDPIFISKRCNLKTIELSEKNDPISYQRDVT